MSQGLYKSISSYIFIVFRNFFCDILGRLTYLKLLFPAGPSATIATIQENYLDCDKLGGKHLNTTLENFSNPLICEGHVITKRPMAEQECFSSIRQFAEEVVQNIKERFSDLSVWPL